jgi:hypothetical protein
LTAYEYDGFVQAMDTFKDRQLLEGLLASGHAPWEVWRAPGANSHSSTGNGRGSRKGQRSRAGTRHA